jgi:hypothetical protein
MGGLAPGLGPVSGNPGPLCGHSRDRVVFGGECLLLLVLKDLALWWFGRDSLTM